MSLLALLLLSFTPLGIGLLTTFPPGRLTSYLTPVSESWTHLLSNIGWHSEPTQLRAAEIMLAKGAGRSPVASAMSLGTDRNVLSYGDRLKITFFESLGVTLGDRGDSPNQTVATIFPRMDLSAEYSVDQSGRLAIPRLGQFTAAGQTATALQSELATAFEQVIGRPSDVHIAITERQPIYVLGVVRNAGTFKHTPGMTVLQALATAGGITPGGGDTSRAIESIRETQRLRQTEARLDSLLIDQARLIALREDSDNIQVPETITPRLSETSGRDRMKILIAGARATLTVERVTYQQQLALTERQVEIARVELEAQNTRAEQLRTLHARKSDRLRELEGIAAHGSVPLFKLSDMRVDISEIAARQEDLRVALAQAERRLVEAEIARMKIQLDHSAGIDKQLSAMRQEIGDCLRAIAAMQAVTQVLRDAGSDSAAASTGAQSVRIARRTADGTTVLPATESTELQPGDVVQVGLVDATGVGPTADATQPSN